MKTVDRGFNTRALRCVRLFSRHWNEGEIEFSFEIFGFFESLFFNLLKSRDNVSKWVWMRLSLEVIQSETTSPSIRFDYWYVSECDLNMFWRDSRETKSQELCERWEMRQSLEFVWGSETDDSQVVNDGKVFDWQRRKQSADQKGSTSQKPFDIFVVWF